MSLAVRDAPIAGDLGAIVRMHGLLYGRERGWDARFEAYVAVPLAELVLRESPRERVWVASVGDEPIGCVAVVEESDEEAQVRWFLVDPAHRGRGVGRDLLGRALAFCREAGYAGVVLWTERGRDAAGHLFAEAGFFPVHERPVRLWGAEIVEQLWAMSLH